MKGTVAHLNEYSIVMLDLAKHVSAAAFKSHEASEGCCTSLFHHPQFLSSTPFIEALSEGDKNYIARVKSTHILWTILGTTSMRAMYIGMTHPNKYLLYE